jgi:hypothetical protein
MIISPGWPKYAKAVIQHEWTNNTLNVWITFVEAMDILSKPSLSVWQVDIDGTMFYPFASDWQDAWTMLLQVANVNSLPDRVLVADVLLDRDLATTTGKQWEPWGPILSAEI